MSSRMQVAAEVADRMQHERRQAVRAAAGWLVAHGRRRQARYLARDVAAILERRGYALVTVTSARPMPEPARRDLEKYIKEKTGARELELVTVVDPAVVGGVQIETPLAMLDATVRTKLSAFIGASNE